MSVNASAVPAVTSAEVSVPTNLIVIHGNGSGNQPPTPPRLPSVQPEIVQMPFSPGTQLIDDILMAGSFGRIQTMCSRRKKYLGCTPDLSQNDNELRLSMEKNDNLSVVHITDLKTLEAGHQAGRKLIGFLRMKLNQGIVIDGELVQDELTFPLQELVDAGLYSAVTSARRGFKAGMPAILSLKMRFDLQCRKSAHPQEELLCPFVSASIENGICRIKLEEDFDWSIFFAFYAPTPKWIFSLKLPAQALALYLHEIARQHTDNVEKGKTITVKLETLRCKLCLSEGTNWNGCRDVLGAVTRAVEAIEIRQSEILKTTELPAINRAEEQWFHVFPGILFGYDPDEPATMKAFTSARLTFKIGGPVQTQLTEFNERKRRKTEAREKKEAKRQEAIDKIVAERTADKQEREATEAAAAETVPANPADSAEPTSPGGLVQQILQEREARARRRRR
ncbi:MAG: hypothetical protein HDQ87_00160 [Clostridia bacterium]|nr:hypothetical protein [Clostridia bacterium]